MFGAVHLLPHAMFRVHAADKLGDWRWAGSARAHSAQREGGSAPAPAQAGLEEEA